MFEYAWVLASSGLPWGVGGFIAGAGFVAALVYAGMIIRKYLRIMLRLVDDYSQWIENPNGYARHSGGEPIDFKASDGHPLAGRIIRTTAPQPRGLVVFAHEFAMDGNTAHRHCKPLIDRGYDVLTFDFRAHGCSKEQVGYLSRPWPSCRERADMLGAIDQAAKLLEREGRPVEVGVVGLSRGAGAAILAAEKSRIVKAIVTDGAFSSDRMIEGIMRRFATIFARIRVVAENHPPVFWRFLRWRMFKALGERSGCSFPLVRKAVRRMGRRPILLIHGEKDRYVPVAQSQMLFDLARGPKSLWVVPGASHNQSCRVDPEGYAKRICRFFDEHLAVPTESEPQTAATPPARKTPARAPREPAPAPAHAV